ncbi:MAG: hydrogenase maturation protease [Oceanospirillaceae bacterium]|nr:hydrogenase maturation protease [Oceanospirillaceae bacterium]
MPDAVLLALGHPARGDDGFGERLLQLFEQRYGAPEAVLCLYGGTRPLAHYDRVAGCRWLILLDAVHSDRTGSGILIADPLPRIPEIRRMAVHELGAGELLQLLAALDEAPARISLVGAAPVSFDMGSTLSTALEQLLPQACDALARLLGDNGIRLTRRQAEDVGHA